MAKKKESEHSMTYVAVGDNREITLTPAIVRAQLATPTREGKMPSDQDIVKFMMLCRSCELDPWASDAFLVGYDGKDGRPSFSMIVAHQALLKRAEASAEFNGMQAGVILDNSDGKPVFREGCFVMPDEIVLGGWAYVYRKNIEHPFYAAINRSAFDTQRSRWKIDPAGMIQKCAEAAALRKAFPTQLGALYAREEMEKTIVEGDRVAPAKAASMDELTKQLNDKLASAVVMPEKAPPKEAVAPMKDDASGKGKPAGKLFEASKGVAADA
jgi:phage recombination protein Bet